MTGLDSTDFLLHAIQTFSEERIISSPVDLPVDIDLVA